MRSHLNYHAGIVAALCLCGCPASSQTTQTPDLSAPGPQADLLAACPPVEPAPEVPLLGRLRQQAPEHLPVGPLYTAGTWPTLPPQLPAGPGKEQLESFCVGCHSLRYIAMQPPLSAQQWTKEVDKMIRDYGAVVGDEARTQILNYLQANFSQAPAMKRP